MKMCVCERVCVYKSVCKRVRVCVNITFSDDILDDKIKAKDNIFAEVKFWNKKSSSEVLFVCFVEKIKLLNTIVTIKPQLSSCK